MNIKTRLIKLETDLQSRQPFCDCFHQLFMAQVRAVYDNEPFDENSYSLPETDYCRKCKKPVNVQFERRFTEQLNLVYGELVKG